MTNTKYINRMLENIEIDRARHIAMVKAKLGAHTVYTTARDESNPGVAFCAVCDDGKRYGVIAQWSDGEEEVIVLKSKTDINTRLLAPLLMIEECGYFVCQLKMMTINEGYFEDLAKHYSLDVCMYKDYMSSEYYLYSDDHGNFLIVRKSKDGEISAFSRDTSAIGCNLGNECWGFDPCSHVYDVINTFCP